MKTIRQNSISRGPNPVVCSGGHTVVTKDGQRTDRVRRRDPRRDELTLQLGRIGAQPDRVLAEDEQQLASRERREGEGRRIYEAVEVQTVSNQTKQRETPVAEETHVPSGHVSNSFCIVCQGHSVQQGANTRSEEQGEPNRPTRLVRQATGQTEANEKQEGARCVNRLADGNIRGRDFDGW